MSILTVKQGVVTSSLCEDSILLFTLHSLKITPLRSQSRHIPN